MRWVRTSVRQPDRDVDTLVWSTTWSRRIYSAYCDAGVEEWFNRAGERIYPVFWLEIDPESDVPEPIDELRGPQKAQKSSGKVERGLGTLEGLHEDLRALTGLLYEFGTRTGRKSRFVECYVCGIVRKRGEHFELPEGWVDTTQLSSGILQSICGRCYAQTH